MCHPFCRSYQHYKLFCSPGLTPLVLLLLLFCLIIERGTCILIMFSCKLTNDEKLNTRSAQHNWETDAIKLPKKQFKSAMPLPKKGFHPKTDRFLILNNFCCCCCFFQFRLFCLQYSRPFLMLVILLLLMNQNISISFL